MRELDRKYWERLLFEPYIQFNFRQIIIRSIENDTYPDICNTGSVQSWIKGEIWKLYDHGLELIGMGQKAIMDENGYWDILKGIDDKRLKNSNYKVISLFPFYRIPYDFMVELDMETDDYYGLPSLYVQYANNKTPYEKTLQGIPGSFQTKRQTQYFSLSMRKNL